MKPKVTEVCFTWIFSFDESGWCPGSNRWFLSEPKAAPGSMAQLVFGPAPAKSVKLALEAVVSQVDGLNFPVSWQVFFDMFLQVGGDP